MLRENESAVLEYKGGVLDASKCVETIIKRFEKLGGKFISGVKVKAIAHDGGAFDLVTTKEGVNFYVLFKTLRKVEYLESL